MKTLTKNDLLVAAAPNMYDALIKTLELLQDGDAEPYQADRLEILITEILNNLEGPI